MAQGSEDIFPGKGHTELLGSLALCNSLKINRPRSSVRLLCCRGGIVNDVKKTLQLAVTRFRDSEAAKSHHDTERFRKRKRCAKKAASRNAKDDDTPKNGHEIVDVIAAISSGQLAGAPDVAAIFPRQIRGESNGERSANRVKKSWKDMKHGALKADAVSGPACLWKTE